MMIVLLFSKKPNHEPLWDWHFAFDFSWLAALRRSFPSWSWFECCAITCFAISFSSGHSGSQFIWNDPAIARSFKPLLLLWRRFRVERMGPTSKGQHGPSQVCPLLFRAGKCLSVLPPVATHFWEVCRYKKTSLSCPVPNKAWNVLSFHFTI